MMKIGKMKRNDYITILVFFVMLNIIDVLGTINHIKINGIGGEGNPLAKILFQKSILLAVGWKFLICFLLTIWIFHQSNKFKKMKEELSTKEYVAHRKSTDIMLLTLVFAMTLTIISNIIVSMGFGILNFEGVLVVSFLFFIFLGIFA